MDGALELGAEFVHGPPAELLDGLGRAGTPVRTIEGDWSAKERRGWRLSTCRRSLEPVLTRLKKHAEPDRPFRRFLRELRPAPHPRTASLALAYVEASTPPSPPAPAPSGLARQEKASEAEGGERPRRVPDGLDRLVEVLRGAASLHLRSVVREVRWRRGAVTVESTTPREVRCPRSARRVR
jgi:hypothetical protein